MAGDGLWLLFGEKPGDKGIGVAVTELMRGLEMIHKLHMLAFACLHKHLHPVNDRFAVFLLDRRKIGSRALHRFLHCHVESFRLLLRSAGSQANTGSIATTNEVAEFRHAEVIILTLARINADAADGILAVNATAFVK
jgi:hypothetical protein